MTDGTKGASTVQFTASNDGRLRGHVKKEGVDENLLNIEINSLNIGREDVGGISPEHTQASIVTIITLTWAT